MDKVCVPYIPFHLLYIYIYLYVTYVQAKDVCNADLDLFRPSSTYRGATGELGGTPGQGVQ